MTIVRSADQPIEIAGVEAPCVKCGRPIVITVPRWLVSTGAPQGKRPKTLPMRLELKAGFGDPGLCLRCRLEALPPPATDVAGEYRATLQAAAAAGIPDGAIIWPIVFAAGHTGPHKQWRGWAGRMLGVQVSGLPPRLSDATGINSFRFELGGDQAPIELVVYQTVLGHEDIPARLAFHSPPGVWPAALEIWNWHRIDRRKDLEALMLGVEFYHTLTDGRGRPPGGPFESRAEFARALYPIITNLRRQDMRPTQERVLQYFTPAESTRQLQRWTAGYFRCGWLDVLSWSEADWRQMMDR